ncbi:MULTISPECIES: hypothetical protein [Brucella]|jgi:hypothetical protein|uniref:Uncharacterized protein n=3 Tax=Brucella TaxID=234 RepID=A6WUX4_BRUA4|nr:MULTISPECIES: hypothetical protein [Brucella/Ochrobactrum group]QOD63600.1 hypothetical protein HGK82_12635 [Ochrobactrum sp. MT180101]QTN01694.1 hypothetical protein GTN27_00225 [Ochrobactrum sp. EEELCW01]ABS12778.1 hypothetical protein Oant_0047 [Brucella anthropi ATCC 49188]MBA8859797.1 hypothetical protein [Brucella anthropi]MBE0559375.1 hypothetical protein [Brucella anthropi]
MAVFILQTLSFGPIRSAAPDNWRPIQTAGQDIDPLRGPMDLLHLCIAQNMARISDLAGLFRQNARFWARHYDPAQFSSGT